MCNLVVNLTVYVIFPLLIIVSLQLLDTEKHQQHNANQHQQQHQNDSWFWEPETNTASSTKNASPAEAETDLTTIPLDSNDHDIIDRLRQQLNENESKVKSLSVENAVLNEKLKHLNAENQELNKSIDELDWQHQIAVEKVLDVKNSLQVKLNEALEDLKSFDQQKEELITKYHNALDAKDAEKVSLISQLDQLKAEKEEMTSVAKKYELQIEEYVETMQNYESEISDLKATVKNHNENSPSSINNECLLKINSLLNSNFKLNEEFINEEHFMEMLTKWMSSTSLKIREMDFDISKLIDENKHIKDEATKHIQERDALKSELINYEIECSELMKNNNILRADIENLRMGGKLETIMENDDDEEADGIISVTASNKIVDDEYDSVKNKLETAEIERTEYYDQIQSLKNQLAENVARCKSYQEEIENLENEKCNYLFELNELKSEEERNILQKELKYYKDREIELTNKLDDIEKERNELQRKYDELQNATSASTETTVEESHKLLSEKESELSKALGELERLKEMNEQLNELENVKLQMTQKLNANEKLLGQLQTEKESLLSKCDELKKINDSNLENLKKSNDQVQELQKKLLESTGTEELKAKIESLQESSAKMIVEKQFFEDQALEMTMQNQSLDEAIQSLTKQNEELEISIKNLSTEKEFLQQSFSKLSQDNQALLAQTELLMTEKQALLTENRLILSKYEDIKKVNDANVESLQNSSQQIQALQSKLLDASSSQELITKIESLEESIAALAKDKESLLTENQSLVVKCNELTSVNNVNLENIRKSTEQVQELQNRLSEIGNVEELKKKLAALEEAALAFGQEKEGLITLVTTKHNENVQYHNEILRLNQLLQDESKKAELTQSEATEQLNDQIKFLREKCDLLAQNLLQEQNNYRLLLQEKNDAVEMNNTLNKDIERLRQHLLEVADAYTFEQVSLQKQVEEYKGKLMAVEADAKQSATAYTSASIRANQQAETLQAQYNLLILQRDELLAKLSAAEDNDNKNQAALTNLQIALEIFQRGEFKNLHN